MGLAVLLALVDVPRNATAVGVLAGPLVVAGYLAGSVPFAYLLSRRRLRRQLDEPGLARLSGSAHHLETGSGLRRTSWALVLPAVATLAATTLAWHLTLAATPGGNTFSAVGIFSNQAVGAWVSVALWTGMAAVVGHSAPVWTGFRGGSGLPPALALGVAYVPMLLVVAAGAFLAVFGATRSHRTALLASLPVVVVAAYVTWLADLQAGWGVTNGPEVTLWATVVATALFARNLRRPFSLLEPA
ncbi:MAG: glycerol-3-phosphate acyltransferase [Actinomycetota bacterium]|nr:glycerol-3-phosphate acyltransferase [Actinomycetota bacterium]MDP9020039.1 glycerol-3-phosphate acyltransferase [Actinomycetota bacterium]